MQTLFSCLGGSSLYGTAHSESDRDIKRIFLPDMNDLLLGRPIKNIMIKTNKVDGRKNGPEDVDQELIPIHTFARDLLGGQTYALELAWAVEYTGAEQVVHDLRFMNFCRQLRTKFMTSSVDAMSGYAMEQAKKYSFKGDRLNAVAATVELFFKFPAGDKIKSWAETFETEAEKLQAEHPGLFEVTDYDCNGKGDMRRCVKVLETTLPYTGGFGYHLVTLKNMQKRYGARTRAASNSTADWKATMHAVRVIDEGIQLFTEGDLVFPYPDPAYVAHLHQIRRGELSREEVDAEIDYKFMELNGRKAVSTLPEYGPRIASELEVWLLDWLREFYT
jgi:hypothetical protein